jgi:mono/diheme cytochrome c family protein
VRFLTEIICALVLLGIAGVAFIYGGWFDVAASNPHSAAAQWAFHTMMRRSVITQAAGIDDTPPFTDDMVKDGFDHYDDMCTVCHGGPGIQRGEIAKGLNPQAPSLADAVKMWTPRQLFWIVKHGVGMTGMPSFGATHTDEEIWSIVAFIEKLPEMTPDQYRAMKRQSGTAIHEHMTHSP